MTKVLLFAEHELNRREVAEMLQALAALPIDGDDQADVTVLVPCSASWAVPLMDDMSATRGSSAASVLGEARHDAAATKASARRTLHHVLLAVREGGHHARGEIVTRRDAVHELATEAVAEGTTTALVVSSSHRLSHLLHSDLEHRLHRAGLAHVIRIRGFSATAAT
jgi:hypothetical protein